METVLGSGIHGRDVGGGGFEAEKAWGEARGKERRMGTAVASSADWRQVCRIPLRGAAALLGLSRAAAFAALEHDVLNVAQAAAYSAVLALFPALVVAAALVGMLPASLPFRGQLGVFFSRVLPANVLPLLGQYFSVTHPSQTVGALAGSLLVTLVGAGNVMATLMEGFRRAHDLPTVSGRFFQRRMRALALVPLSIVPMAAASALVVFGNIFTHWMVAELPRSLAVPFILLALLVRWSIALCGSVAILLLIYHLGTDLSVGVRERMHPRHPYFPSFGFRTLASGKAGFRKVGFRHGHIEGMDVPSVGPPAISSRQLTWRFSFPGAALGTLLWFPATLLFGYYVTRYANYSRVYGSLGAGIALMIWLYLIALCVLAGAEFNAQVYRAFMAETDAGSVRE